MSRDPRVSRVNDFTKTKHQAVPASQDPSTAKLPESFTICILGASTGIGEHIAYSYAKAHAANVIIASRTLDDLETVAGEITRINPDSRLSTKITDVSKAADVEALAQHVKTEFGRLDVLILNAGYAGPVTTKMHEGNPVWVQKAFEVNAIGTYLCAHYFVPLLLESENGAKAFFAIGSIAGCIRRGPIANTGYTVSKMAQIRLMECLAEQYSEEGLFSLAIHPGAVMTRMAQGNTPEVFLPYLTDSVDLCGAVCVYLSRRLRDFAWLNGRLISATWDMDELMAKRGEVVDRDLLKFALVTEP